LSKIDLTRIARYADLAISLSKDMDQKDSSVYSDGLDIGSLLDRIQNNQNIEPTDIPVGEGMFLAPRTRNLNGVDIACVGIPLDQSEGFNLSGPRQGPNAVRYASAGQGEIYEPTGLNIFNACSIIDWGDVRFTQSPGNIRSRIARVAEIYLNFAEQGVATLSIGGQHISTYGILEGLALGGERPLAMIHLGAQHRANGDRFGPRLDNSGFMRLATVKGLIDPEKSLLAGVRGQGLSGLEFSKQTGMTVVTARTFQSRRPQDVAEEVRDLVGDNPCYISIDTNVLDCGVLPSAKAPIPFGLTAREIRDFLDGLCGLKFVGADLMEFAPHYDNACISSALASAIGFELLGLLATASIAREESHFQNKETCLNPGFRQLA